jgi:hypothetical protein
MNTQSINFRDAIRMVHPDSNPNIQDAGTKVREVMRFKKSPTHLFILMVRWGLVKEEIKPAQETKSTKFKLQPNKYYFGSVFIIHKTKGILAVERTTNKRVYFTDADAKEAGIKYCSFKSVTGII